MLTIRYQSGSTHVCECTEDQLSQMIHFELSMAAAVGEKIASAIWLHPEDVPVLTSGVL